MGLVPGAAGAAVSWWFGGLFHGDLGTIHGDLDSWGFAGRGRPKQRPLLDRHTHTRAPRFRKPKRLKSFEKLLKHPTSKDNGGYVNHMLLVMVSPKGDPTLDARVASRVGEVVRDENEF